MKMTEGYAQVTGGKVFYRIAGEGKKSPILTVHGGPGFPHDLLLPLKELAVDRQVIFYDQLGAGKSDRPNDLSLWRVERFVEELGQLRAALGLDELILWSVSWGTMLVVDYMLTQPKGVKALILSNPCLSARMWKEDADRLRLKLPPEVQATLLRHEAAGTTQSEEYEKVMWEYLNRYVCRLDPLPQAIHEAFAQANRECYLHMWGPSEFHPTGNLKNYDRTPDLHKISQRSLFICGEHDEATPESTRKYASLMPHAGCEVVSGASHLTFMEKPAEYMALMRKFIAEIDSR